VEDEVAKVISTEIDTERDAGKWVGGILVPEWNLDHVEVLAGDSGRLLGPIQLEIILRFHEKMQLMEVEFVVFWRAVLDGPFFDRALGGHDVGGSVGIELVFRLPFHSHEKLCLLDFVEEHRAPYCDGRRSEASETRLSGIQCRKCPDLVVVGAVLVIVRTHQRDRCQWPLRVVVAKWTGVDTERDELSEPYRSWRRRHNELHASSRRKREVSHRNRVAWLGAVLGIDRDAVNGDYLNPLRHSVEHVLEVQDGVGTGVRNAPELLLSRFHV